MSRRRRNKDDEPPRVLRLRPQEQLLVDLAAELPTGRLLCNTTGRGHFPRAYIAAHPDASAVCWFLDVYQRDRAAEGQESRVERQEPDEADDDDEGNEDEEELFADDVDDEVSDAVSFEDLPVLAAFTTPPDPTPALNPQISTLDFTCTADPPDGPFDVVGWSFGTRGENELVREMLQLGYLRLKGQGRFAAAIDNPDDQWLHNELRKLYPKVTRRPVDTGVVYLATKPGPLAKEKRYDAEFVFRDRDRLITAYSRPSVFSHRHIDTGARTLINSMEIRPGMRVLDLGCGSGVVSLAALCRAENVTTLAIDSNPRALQCAERGAAANGLTGLTTSLDASGATVPAGKFDLVLANPPYFSHYRIAELFLQIAQRALKPRGIVHVVTKTPNWFAEVMPGYFADVSAEQVKDYWVLTAVPKVA